MAASDVLAVAFSLLGIPLGAKVLDCCSGDGQLAYDLSSHFGNVTLNDLDPKTRAQFHYDVRRPDFWQTVVHGAYEFVITKPPGDVAETIIMQAHEHCSLVAVLVTSEKLSQLQTLLSHKTPSISIAMGTTNTWLIWTPLLAYKNVFLDLAETDMELRHRVEQGEWLSHLKERLAFAISRSYSSSSSSAAAVGLGSGLAHGLGNGSAASSQLAAAASHAGVSPFGMPSHPFYPQSQFQPSPYAGFGYPDATIEQYHQLSYAAAKRGGALDPYGSTASLAGLSAGDLAHLGGGSSASAQGGAASLVKREVASSTGSASSADSNASTATLSGVNGSINASAGSAGSLPNPSSPFVDFAGLPLGAAYPGARGHPSSAYGGQPVLPYYARSPAAAAAQPASPNQWQFQQAPWASPPGFAAHMASIGPGANGAHVPGAYAAPQFNPAAILMDMDKLNRPDLLSPNAAAAAAAAAVAAAHANSSPYSLHKPTAFKASNVPGAGAGPAGMAGSGTSPSPSSIAAIEDQQLMLSQAEMLYLKGVHAAKQGKALEDAIDKYRSMYSKKDVITKVCKMKYRSAQRKLRIAKHIQRFPEISTMTQRQAERYISEKLRKSRNVDNGRGAAGPESESD